MESRIEEVTPIASKRSRKSEKISPTEKLTRKRKLSFDWRELVQSLSRTKDDFIVSYYMSNFPGGAAIFQADRDYIARVMAFFSRSFKRMVCPTAVLLD